MQVCVCVRALAKTHMFYVEPRLSSARLQTSVERIHEDGKHCEHRSLAGSRRALQDCTRAKGARKRIKTELPAIRPNQGQSWLQGWGQ